MFGANCQLIEPKAPYKFGPAFILSGMSVLSAVCPIQVGREAETERVAGAIGAAVRSGTGKLLLVGGVAGVGKSRLAAEAARVARAQDMLVLEGQCTADAGVPYAAFVTALRRRTRTQASDRLAQLFAGPALPAAALLPEVAQQLAAKPSLGDLDSLFAATWQLLSRLAQPAGALLLLEDLHWADEDSLRMLAYLARELGDLPLCIVGTYRTDEMHRRHPLARLMGELGRERRFEALELEALDFEQVRSMVSAIFDGTQVSDEFCAALLERTEGNPFFVEELLKALMESGDIYRESGDWERRDLNEIELPISVRDSLLARARSMSPEMMDVLKLAALAGVELDPPVLSAASQTSPALVESLIQAGLQMQFLVEHRDSGPARYAFRHALSREAFADELVGPDRRRAHRILAEAIATVHADEPATAAAGIADHFTAAGDQVAAAPFALTAARVAANSYAGDEAERRFDQALRGYPLASPERLEVLLEACYDQMHTQVSKLQVAFAEEARRLARELDDPIAEANAMFPLELARWLAGDGTGAVTLMQEALVLVHGRDDYLEARIVSRMTRLMFLGDRDQESDALMPGGIELATKAGNFSALSRLHGTRMMAGNYLEVFQGEFDAAVAAARAADDWESEANACTNGGFIALWNCDFEQSRRSLLRAIEICDAHAPNERYMQAGLAWLSSLLGDYEAAERLAAPLREYRLLPTRVVALSALAEVALWRGDANLGELTQELVSVAAGMGENQRSIPALGSQARFVLQTSGIDAAAPLFSELFRRLNESHAGSHWFFSPDFAKALAAEGRIGELREWAQLVAAKNGSDFATGNLAAELLVQAYLAAGSNDLMAAATSFRSAVDAYHRMPCPAREAEANLGLASVLLGNDPAAARINAQEAFDLASGIGAQALIQEAAQLLERTTQRSVLATVLFTDIVGSTETAARLGDIAWRELIERHHMIVRRELLRADGRELDTAGDGFLAAFTSPAAAIRCAVSIRSALKLSGISVRAGLHTGECQESGGKLTGLTVHIAARVSQSALAGEILVSGTVKDLVAGSLLTFEDHGVHELKGIPGTWPIFIVSGG